jgi:hypothetical protein
VVIDAWLPFFFAPRPVERAREAVFVPDFIPFGCMPRPLERGFEPVRDEPRLDFREPAELARVLLVFFPVVAVFLRDDAPVARLFFVAVGIIYKPPKGFILK